MTSYFESVADLATAVHERRLRLMAWFVALLALGDVPLALGTIFGLPWALGRTHRELLTNDLAR